MKKAIALGAMLIFGDQTVLAEEIVRNVAVTKLLPMSKSRIVQAPNSQGLTRVYFTSAPWGTSDCRGDAADILPADTHILSVLLAAWTAGKTIRVGVETTVKPIDTVCRLSYIEVL